MKILFTANIGSNGLMLEILEHPDAPGEFVIELQRHGVRESNLETFEELRILADALALATIKIPKQKQ